MKRGNITRLNSSKLVVVSYKLTLLCNHTYFPYTNYSDFLRDGVSDLKSSPKSGDFLFGDLKNFIIAFKVKK